MNLRDGGIVNLQLIRLKPSTKDTNRSVFDFQTVSSEKNYN